MIRVLIADDHVLFRRGMRGLLGAADDIEVQAEAGSGEEVLQQVRTAAPDLVLMDLNMPGMGGLEATRRLQRHHPDVSVVVVTAVDSEPMSDQLLDSGARGYVTKESDPDELVRAIRTVAAGGHFLSSDIANRLALRGVGGRGSESPLSRLTARELQVMTMIVRGMTNQEIADALFVAVKTVSTFRGRIQEKLEVENDVQLTHFALRHEMLDPAEL
jgi:two-component system invasion response regulator UvrY